MKYWQRTTSPLIIICVTLLSSSNVLAGSVTIPNSFSSGTPAVAAEVNDNFSAIKTAVDDNDSRINQLKTNLSNTMCAEYSYIQGFDENNNVICSDGASGTDYVRKAPVYEDNLTNIEIQGYMVYNPVVIISGLGVELERIPQFVEPGPDFAPGLNMEDDFVIEVNIDDEPDLKTMFDDPSAGRRDMSIIVRDLTGVEAFRFNLYEYAAAGYEYMGEGRTRFTFAHQLPENNAVHIDLATPAIFGNASANNPETDTLVEISGITSGLFYPQVEDDVANRTLTLTYDINEGEGLYEWFKRTAAGTGSNRSLSVIQQSAGVETSRENFFEVFPIRWEIYDGFALPQKIRAKVVLSYDKKETLISGGGTDLPPT